MCKRHGAVLHLVHLKEDTNLVFPPGKNPQILEMVLEAELAVVDRLESQANKIMEENEIVCFYHTAEGPYYKTISSKAKDLQGDLIILEKNRSGTGFSLVKKNSIYRVLRYSGCAVLTVPYEQVFLNFKNILFPVRPLRSALEKLYTTLPIIRKNDSKVLLFSPLKPELEKEERQTVNELMQRADQIMSEDKVPVERELKVAHDLAREVVKKAIEKKSDLIVITAIISKGIKAAFTRDYTQKVIEDSPVPVLSVKTA